MKKTAVLTIIASICFIFLSCASSPYTIVQAVEKESLALDTVILEVGMAPRSLTVLPLIDAGIYNTVVRNTEDEFAPVEETKLRAMNRQIIKAYADMYSANSVSSDFSFEGEEVSLDYFSNASQGTKERLVALCEENNAEVIVAIMGQIRCTGVSAFGINGGNLMMISVCIFNKEGQIIAQGRVSTDIRVAKPADTESYGLLFDDGTTLCISLLQELTAPKK